MTASPAPRLLVTGGASGIGLAIVRLGLAHGRDVVVIDRDPAPVGRGIRADLADPDATAAALSEALSDGPITRLVNNVGRCSPLRSRSRPWRRWTLPSR